MIRKLRMRFLCQCYTCHKYSIRRKEPLDRCPRCGERGRGDG